MKVFKLGYYVGSTTFDISKSPCKEFSVGDILVDLIGSTFIVEDLKSAISISCFVMSSKYLTKKPWGYYTHSEIWDPVGERTYLSIQKKVALVVDKKCLCLRKILCAKCGRRLICEYSWENTK